MPDQKNADAKPKRRSQQKRELEALAELARILKPFDSEQRERLLKAVDALIGPQTF